MTGTKWSPQISRAMHEFGNAAPTPPTAARLSDRQASSPRQPRVAVTLAAAAIAVAAAVGLGFTLGTTSSPEPATTPPPPTVVSLPVDGAVLLPDPVTTGVTVVSDQSFGPLFQSGGAVLAPDQTVFGFVLNRPRSGEPNPSAETRIVGGREVEAVADGSVPTEIYRTIATTCATLTITTADEEAWSDDTLALVESVTFDGPRVEIALPAGWSDLGSSPAGPQHIIELSVDSQGQPVQLFLQQMTGVPASYFLSTTESTPRAIDLDGSTAWSVDGATTPGWHSIIGEREGIGFSLSGMLSADELTAIARSLATTNESSVVHRDVVFDTIPGNNPDEPSECGEPTLTITPFPKVVPVEQREALADGVVTLEEYQAAFNAFRTCARDNGGEVIRNSTNPVTGEMTYQTDGILLAIGQTGGSVENECYQKYFAQTEVIFSTTDPGVLANLPVEQMQFFNEVIRPCLESVGIEIPDDLVFASDDWSRLLDENTKAHQAGQCGGTSDTTSP